MIGIFDSGCGGLSVLEALRGRAPQADIVYFGDIANAPYGNKTPEELAALVARGLRVLSDHGATELIAACNSVALSVLNGSVDHDRVIEMTRPTARMMRTHAGEHVLLLATAATVHSGIYRDALKPIVQLDECAVPELAGAIERGASKDEIAGIVRLTLEQHAKESYGGVLLACTHFPLVRDIIEKEANALWGNVRIIDPAVAVAEEALERFDTTGSGRVHFLISRDSHEFRNHIAPMYLNGSCTLEVL